MISYGLHTIEPEDIEAVSRVLSGKWLTQGPAIEAFEKQIAEYCGTAYAVVFNSGTAALHAAYFALGLSPNDEMITSSMTFAATSNAALYLGAKPTFIDIDDYGNLDPNLLPEQSQAKIIVPVHFAGQSVDMQSIYNWARPRGIAIVEDACHGMGGDYGDRKIGSCQFSDACVFSFHPVKPITTGEGGAVTTQNKEIYQKLLLFRSHGIQRTEAIQASEGPWAYEMVALGYNYRMTDLGASLGQSQLLKLNRFIQRRREIAEIYFQELSALKSLSLPSPAFLHKGGWHLFPILVQNSMIKLRLYEFLKSKGVLCQVHYKPVNSHPYYQNLGYSVDQTPRAWGFYQRELSIPIYPKLENADILNITQWIREFFDESH